MGREPVTEMAEAAPGAPALHGLVERYDCYFTTGHPPGTHRGLPSGTLTLVVSLDDPVDLARMPNSHQSPGRYPALLGGLHQTPVVIRRPAVEYGIQAAVHPFAARALFGRPASALASTVYDLADLWGRRHVDELLNRLVGAAAWPDRTDILDRFLADRVRRSDRPDQQPRAEVARAWQLLVASGGTRDIASVAAEVGWSSRHLSHQVRAELGATPKALARALRFKRSSDLLRRPDRPGLGMVAALCGYSDQSHLTRDWQELAGMSPGAWLRAEVPGEPVTVEAGERPQPVR